MILELSVKIGTATYGRDTRRQQQCCLQVSRDMGSNWKGLTRAQTRNNHEDYENRYTYMEQKEEAILWKERLELWKRDGGEYLYL